MKILRKIDLSAISKASKKSKNVGMSILNILFLHFLVTQ